MVVLRIALIAALAVLVALAMSYVAFAATPTEACSLLTAGQVSAVLGVQIGPGEGVVPTSPKMCGFGGAAPKCAVVSMMTVDMFAHERHPLEGIKEEQAAGLGDDAHYMTTPGFGTGLSVLKGGYGRVQSQGLRLPNRADQAERESAGAGDSREALTTGA